MYKSIIHFNSHSIDLLEGGTLYVIVDDENENLFYPFGINEIPHNWDSIVDKTSYVEVEEHDADYYSLAHKIFLRNK
jgi:hypothetical protein